MWYSTIYYSPTLPATTTSNPFSTTSTTLQNFAIDGNAVAESTAGGNGGAIYMNGSNWLINSLWVRHEGAGVWASGTNGTVEKTPASPIPGPTASTSTTATEAPDTRSETI
jgi:hypothetical protein